MAWILQGYEFKPPDMGAMHKAKIIFALCVIMMATVLSVIRKSIPDYIRTYLQVGCLRGNLFEIRQAIQTLLADPKDTAHRRLET